MIGAGQRAHQLAVAVIGGVGADDAALAGGEAGHAQGDLHRLGAGAREDDTLDGRALVQGDQPLGEDDDPLVQIAVVGVERGLLVGHGPDDSRMGVPDAGDVIVHVQVAPTVGVVEPHALAADEGEGVLVEQLRPGPQRPLPPGEKISGHEYLSSASFSPCGRRWPAQRVG